MLHKQTKQKKHPIAVKRLEDKRPSDHPRDLSEKFKTERSVLQRLVSGNRSQHLIKLLATFETPGRNCPNKYHFVFEAADGTIETLWRDETLWGKHADRASLSRWVARQCHGLAEGLAQFHRFQRGPGDDNTKTRGMHGDIKPDNIFWYRDWIVNDDPSVAQGDRGATLGILQIADFGLSNFYSTGSVQDVKYLGTSNDYLAPETELWLCHPPLSDVWELGCLFLDFATWLVTGPKGYEDFTNNRSSRGPFTSRERFSTFERVSKTEVDLTVSSQVWEVCIALSPVSVYGPCCSWLIQKLDALFYSTRRHFSGTGKPRSLCEISSPWCWTVCSWWSRWAPGQDLGLYLAAMARDESGAMTWRKDYGGC